MSTAIFRVSIVEVATSGGTARIRLRLHPIASAGDRCVTRSFIIRFLAGDSEVAPAFTPPALGRAVREAGLEPWPDASEVLRLHAPVIDRLVTTTRVVAEHPDDSYELEAELPDPRFVEGLHAGQTFDTYAGDVWFEDPRHPLASAADRARWATAQAAAIAELQQRARTDLAREADDVGAWLARAEAAEQLAIAKGTQGRVAKKVASLIQKADDPDEAAAAVIDFLMSSDDVEDVFVDDRELRESLASLLG